MVSWWTQLPLAKRVLTAVLFFLLVGATVALTVGDYYGLPARMSTVEYLQSEQGAKLDRMDNKLDRVLCILALPEGASPLSCERGNERATR